MALNRWQGIGNLGADPDVRYTQSGEMIANLRLACNEKYKDKSGERQEVTEWVKIVTFGRRAEVIAEYCHKGSKLFAEGKLRTRKWQDRDGNDKYSTEIVLSGFEFLDGKNGNGSVRTQAQASYPEASRPKSPASPGAEEEFEDDLDIPF